MSNILERMLNCVKKHKNTFDEKCKDCFYVNDEKGIPENLLQDAIQVLSENTPEYKIEFNEILALYVPNFECDFSRLLFSVQGLYWHSISDSNKHFVSWSDIIIADFAIKIHDKHNKIDLYKCEFLKINGSIEELLLGSCDRRKANTFVNYVSMNAQELLLIGIGEFIVKLVNDLKEIDEIDENITETTDTTKQIVHIVKNLMKGDNVLGYFIYVKGSLPKNKLDRVIQLFEQALPEETIDQRNVAAMLLNYSGKGQEKCFNSMLLTDKGFFCNKFGKRRQPKFILWDNLQKVYYGENSSPDRKKILFETVDQLQNFFVPNDSNSSNSDYIISLFEEINSIMIANKEKMVEIGDKYREGKGIVQDYGEAMKWYQKAADLNNSHAMVRIGDMYRDGIGVVQDYAEAMAWYKKAADIYDSEARETIGDMYRDGIGVAQDYVEAIVWYQKASSRGNSKAMIKIGDMYYNESMFAPNRKRALEDYKTASFEDYESAMSWYQKAAELNNGEAMEKIGNMYRHGEGVDSDAEEAEKWLQKALSAGKVNHLE